MQSAYESQDLLNEYLLFHYGSERELFPYAFGPREALNYPVRCVLETLDLETLPTNARALEVGCAVGRSTFELARYCSEVIGIDFSESFIRAAQTLNNKGKLDYQVLEEGDRVVPARAIVAEEIDRSRVSFETGDAMNLRQDLGAFDVVLAANLLCRLREPMAFLSRLAELVTPGGQLILMTPCSWMEAFTPRENWLGGQQGSTLESLKSILLESFDFYRSADMPFLIREHERKFQWTVAQASIWRRKK